MMRRVVTKRSDRASVAAWPLPPPYIKNAELAKPSMERHLFSEWEISGAGEGRLAPEEETFHFKRLHFCAFHLSRLYKRASKSPRAAKIQRDYSNKSFFDYYYHKDENARNPLDVKMTDSGRTVYGGGGITPDEKYVTPQFDSFQKDL